MTDERKIYRGGNSVVSGVCAGVAQRLDMDPILIRVLVILLTLLTVGFFAFFYVALWITLPKRIEQGTIEAADLEEPLPRITSGMQDVSEDNGIAWYGALGVWAIATAFCFLFSFLVISRFSFLDWWCAWPFAVINAGLAFMFLPLKGTKPIVAFTTGLFLLSLGVFLVPFSTEFSSWITIARGIKVLWPVLLVIAGLMLVSWGQGKPIFMLLACALLVGLLVSIVVFFNVPGDSSVYLLLQNQGVFSKSTGYPLMGGLLR